MTNNRNSMPALDGVLEPSTTNVTQKDIAEMTDAELALFAAKAPDGFTMVRDENGVFSFCADWSLEEMTSSQRAKITVIGRAH